jgi:RNA polymerase sigma-70 factor, ECF subfamily
MPARFRIPSGVDIVSLFSRRAENEEARFEALLREHHPAIFRVAFRLSGSREEAEDLVQETLIEAYEAFGRFSAGTHFDRWVFRIMRNTYIDRVRRRPKARIESLDAGSRSSDGQTRVREIIDLESAPDLELMASTLDGPIQEALDALPEEFRTVVILVDIESLSYEETSRIVGCPVGTVRSRLHRGRAILKDKLKKYVRF